jgi:formamidopyrimidine-DNA glycosylase
MPEGPEVKQFVDNLNHNFRYYMIKSVNILSGRYTKKPINNINLLVGKEIKSFNCKGKFIWLDLDDVIVFNTLGMTGNWSRKKSKHSRIEFNFYENDTLYFNDIRNFGTFQVKTRSDLEKKLKSIGPDMLSNPPDNFVSLMRKKNNKNICEVLMNQKVISGVGNYIKAESLWYSRINPHAMIKDLTDENLDILDKAIRFVINKSYDEQGASIQSYYTFDGDNGNAAQGFVVYGRQKDYNGHKVIKEETLDKRTTHWVKERQTIGT